MNELRDFERELRTALVGTERGAELPDGLTERLIANTPRPAANGYSGRARFRRIRWLPPALAAAAVVIAVVIAQMITTAVVADHHSAPLTQLPTVHPTSTPTRQTPTTAHSTAPATTAPATTAPATTTSPTPTTTTTSSSSPSSKASATPSTHTVTLGGARLSLPADWVGRLMPNVGPPTYWCLMPRSQSLPPNGDSNQCPIEFRAISARPAAGDVNSNIAGGMLGNPEWCGQTADYTAQLLDYGDRTFGGRQADYRRWRFLCPNVTWNVEQYVVDTAPGYVLYSQHADLRIHTIIDRIAAESRLPAATSTMRYDDAGIIRTIKHEPDGYHITLDRVVLGIGKPINNNPATYPYVVPDSVLAAKHGATPTKLAVGRLLLLTTDGQQVNGVTVSRS